MAHSKHAHLRYNIIDYCFKNKAFTFKELLQYVNDKIASLYPGEGISERTLREDIKLFKDPINGFGAPLEEKSRNYKYSNTEFSIATKPLLEYEQYLIEASQQLLERFENHPKYNKLAEALIKFQDEGDNDENQSGILFYDHNDEYKGIQYLKPLYLAIKKKQALMVTYKGFGDVSEKYFEFHPHVLKQYNRRWFVFGYNKTANRQRHSIPLDERLIGFETLENAVYIRADNDWDMFFRTMVGVTRVDQNIERVVLRFYNGREKYFKTKPFIPDFEEFFEANKQDQVWFETTINKELMQQILSYGQDVEVLEPEALRAAIKNHILQANSYYVT